MMKRLADLIQKEADSIKDKEPLQGEAAEAQENATPEEATADEAEAASPTIGEPDKAD